MDLIGWGTSIRRESQSKGLYFELYFMDLIGWGKRIRCEFQSKGLNVYFMYLIGRSQLLHVKANQKASVRPTELNVTLIFTQCLHVVAGSDLVTYQWLLATWVCWHSCTVGLSSLWLGSSAALMSVCFDAVWFASPNPNASQTVQTVSMNVVEMTISDRIHFPRVYAYKHYGKKTIFRFSFRNQSLVCRWILYSFGIRIWPFNVGRYR